jgi:acetylornithine/succinyldiaminopimelate/putrescine aminotransferase
MSVGGVCLPPPTYLAHVTDGVRARKGCVIYDCVQTGCGRFGENKWWGFEREDGAVPDIVTVGKPLGNGHPISALCVKKSVIRNFDTCGMEYFNTFGGNPVSCAAGLAVMEEVRRTRSENNWTMPVTNATLLSSLLTCPLRSPQVDRMRLPQNAEAVGSYLMSRFQGECGEKLARSKN